MSFVIRGLGISRGSAIGRVHVVRNVQPELNETGIRKSQIAAEITRLEDAIKQAREGLQDIQKQIPAELQLSVSGFINTHILMLADGLLIDKPIRLIKDTLCNAERAVRLNRDTLVGLFEDIADPYLRARKEDVIQVVNRILVALAGQLTPARDIGKNLRGCVVVAEDLNPEDVVLLCQRGAVAFATERGGRTSHTAVIARNLRVPAVGGLSRVTRYVLEDEEVIIDGAQGVLLMEANDALVGHYRKRVRRGKKQRASLKHLRRCPTRTRDDIPIELQANTELPEDFATARALGAHGVGMYRTEFLFVGRSAPPDEEEHYAAYRAALEQLDGLPLCIRTLDIDAARLLYHQSDAASVQSNPAMGMRAIRLCLREPALFVPQLRAVLRASALGKVRLLLPMISSIDEVQQVRDLLRDLRRELDACGTDYDRNMPVGGMIEVPAAAVTADIFARCLDFLAIGTNDLSQYTLAMDRTNKDLSHLCESLHPAVLRLICQILETGAQFETAVMMCGELAGETRYTRLLLALGLRAFSVHPANLLEVRQRISESDVGKLAAYRARAQQTASPQALAELVAEMNVGD